MLQKFVRFFNHAIFRINLLLMLLLIVWSVLGIWDIIDRHNMVYWQILLTIVAVLFFNILLLVTVVGLYRHNLKIIDVFNESQYATQHSADEIIFHYGEPGHEMYLLIKGKIEISAHDQILEIIEPGGVFGEMAIIDHQPRSGTARCLTECKLVKINEKRFYDLVQEVPFFALEVMKLIARRLRAHDQY